MIKITIYHDTNIILLDEPTTYLDMTHQIEILDLLFELNETENRTIVMVLHDLNLACRYAHNIVAIRDRKSTRLNSSHVAISYVVFCLSKKLYHLIFVLC